MQKKESFEAIKKYFEEKDRKGLEKGSLPMRSTQRGFWGVSNLDDVYDFFSQLQFDPNTRFIDLGCGDGRVSLVASLFVQASGLEFDGELISQANKAATALNSEVNFIESDMRESDFSQYDILYMYMDQQFDFLKQKLLNELTGTLYLYHDTYHPEFLEKGKITWVGQIPIFSYKNTTNQ